MWQDDGLVTTATKMNESTSERTLHGARAKYAGGLHSVAADTWAWLQPNGDLGESNAGFVVNGEHALLVDTLWDLKLTHRMLEAAERAGIPRPETVFNSHSDGDHYWGNQLLADAQIISSTNAKKLMRLDPPAEMRRMRTTGRIGGAIGSLPLPVIGTLRVRGLPSIPLREMGRMMMPFDWRGIELTLPNRTFDGRMEIAVGDRTVELIEVGPAHTQGDSVAWTPDVSVCFAADVLFIGCTPIMWAGPVESWIRALDRILALNAQTYVPGHGPVCGRDEVQLLRRYFEWVKSDGVSQLKNGVPPVKAARNLLLSDQFASLPWAGWDDPSRLLPILCTEQYVRDGGQGHLRGLGRSRAITQMQRVRVDVERRHGGHA